MTRKFEKSPFFFLNLAFVFERIKYLNDVILVKIYLDATYNLAVLKTGLSINQFCLLINYNKGEKRAMKFAVPRIWQEPTNYSSDCYFCLVDPSKCRAGKNAFATRYSDIPFSIAPVPHSAQLTVPTNLPPKK